ncbi:menaquinone-dependent protoporphyrinogen oxidase [Alkalispirochaeta americana]|uniref:Menaquinone-dependent protoporphyrinogen oxidase n=1 Tax=Alkalispirochaeta americana TaxID=159291 RepID=A0A1N6PXM7_9SPIO|nr:flavodoxin domain-containing protein [Alkalispirochaeta americana]SIQ09081.1 menaquinone-dependent protoporphyrinogen oxidase [Alkalispirochaeta americana]
MKTLIVYATRYGATEKASRTLARQLHGDITLVNLVREDAPNPGTYDQVLIGGSIYAGSIQKEVRQFCTAHQEQLLCQTIGLFVCCREEHTAREQLETSLGVDLVAHATSTGSFGYEFDFSSMNIFFRLVIRILAKTKESQFNLREEKIKEFAAHFAPDHS